MFALAGKVKTPDLELIFHSGVSRLQPFRKINSDMTSKK